MRRMIISLAAFGAVACTASRGSSASDHLERSAPVDSVPLGHADVDLTGTWATGTAGEPAARRIVLRLECNYTPPLWVIQQSGDTVQLWTIPARRAQGVPSPQPGSSTPAMGRVSGIDLRINTAGARYSLRYDSTSSHLRGTLNGAPFWAAQQDLVRPKGCLPPP